MKQYLLSVYQPGPEGQVPPPEVLEPVQRNLAALHKEMVDAGVWVFSAGLNGPSTATVLRVRDDEVLVTDGPFVEGKEYLGGFTIIKAPDLDAALEWGRKTARAIGLLPIEVRPFADETDD